MSKRKEYGYMQSCISQACFTLNTLYEISIALNERKKFILQHDVKDMTTRELDQALKERNQTAPEKEQAQVTPMSNNPEDIKIIRELALAASPPDIHFRTVTK
jgi:hypothetical protein